MIDLKKSKLISSSLQDVVYELWCLAYAFEAVGNEKMYETLIELSTTVNVSKNLLNKLTDDTLESERKQAQMASENILHAIFATTKLRSEEDK